MQKRGQLTKRVQEYAKEVFNREISQTELRLMPYVQYTMVNDQRLDPHKINQEEREILSVWRKKGYIEGGASRMCISEEFWGILCHFLFLAYVDIDQYEGQRR